MSQDERIGLRDAHYSVWHRARSIKRYVGIENAQRLSMIDIDAALYVEYDDATKEPVALIETARDVGQAYKTATVLRCLARRADLPAFVVLYKVGDTPNPADHTVMDIESFRVRRLWPTMTKWHDLSPLRWSEALLRIRTNQTARLDAEEGDPVNQVAAAKIA
jgi:hypothetical protein